MKPVKFYNSYECYDDNFKEDEVVAILNTQTNRLGIDMTTECKNYKTAINRMFRVLLKDIRILELINVKDLYEDIIESCKSGYFKISSKEFSYEIYNLDNGLHYVNVMMEL